MKNPLEEQYVIKIQRSSLIGSLAPARWEYFVPGRFPQNKAKDAPHFSREEAFAIVESAQRAPKDPFTSISYKIVSLEGALQMDALDDVIERNTR